MESLISSGRSTDDAELKRGLLTGRLRKGTFSRELTNYLIKFQQVYRYILGKAQERQALLLIKVGENQVGFVTSFTKLAKH